MNKKGFTLIEILMVLVILVSITVAGTFGIQSIQKKSEEKSLEELYSQILSAADVYLNENETFTTDILNKEVDEKCIRIYTLQNEGLLSTSLTNPVTKKLIPGNLCVISYLGEDGTIKNVFSESTDTKKVTLNVINGSGDAAYKNVHHKATFTVTPNEGYLLELESDTCGGTLSGNSYTISNITSAKTCTIIFKFVNPYANGTLSYKLLEDKTTRLTSARGTGYNTVYIADNTKTLYTAKENGTTVYYFAGNATDNWVKFGGFYWRIIRTNSDGGVRLLYHGISHDTTEAYIEKSSFYSKHNDPMYVGYMYGTSGSLVSNRTNINNSTIKDKIDTWYAQNMTSYTKYLSTTAVYCSDRSNPVGGYNVGSTRFYYAAYTRLFTNKTPSYDCTAIEDKFTVDTSTGNGKLTYPISLMTADEVSFAGGLWATNAPTWYYYNSASGSSTGSTDWWLLSPNFWDNSFAIMFIVGSSSLPGFLGYNDVGNASGVRPAISLKSCVKYSSGDGSAENPYTIEETSSGC